MPLLCLSLPQGLFFGCGCMQLLAQRFWSEAHCSHSSNPTHLSIWIIRGTEKPMIAAVTGVHGLVSSLPVFAVVDGERCWCECSPLLKCNSIFGGAWCVILHLVVKSGCPAWGWVKDLTSHKAWIFRFTISPFQNRTSNFYPPSGASLSPLAPACFTSFLFDAFPLSKPLLSFLVS